METETITFNRDEARELWRAYKKHKHYSEPVDEEIAAIYQKIAQGRTVIRAIASIAAAGVHTSGPYLNLPKLAIGRADLPEVRWQAANGGGVFVDAAHWSRRSNEAFSRSVVVPRGMWPGMTNAHPNGAAKLPPIPLHLRPKRGLASYHILWEAEWKPLPPGDPMLLRRIGRSDAWLVVAAWDLTPIERAALATRMNS